MIRKVELALLAMGGLFLVLLVGTFFGLVFATAVKVWEIHEMISQVPIVGIEMPSITEQPSYRTEL